MAGACCRSAGSTTRLARSLIVRINCQLGVQIHHDKEGEVDINSDVSLGALHSFNLHTIPAQLKMLFTNYSSFLPLLQFLPFSSAAEQKLLKNGKSSPFDKKFEKLVYETLELWHVPGVAIGVVDGDLEWSEVSI